MIFEQKVDMESCILGQYTGNQGDQKPYIYTQYTPIITRCLGSMDAYRDISESWNSKQEKILYQNTVHCGFTYNAVAPPGCETQRYIEGAVYLCARNYKLYILDKREKIQTWLGAPAIIFWKRVEFWTFQTKIIIIGQHLTEVWASKDLYHILKNLTYFITKGPWALTLCWYDDLS